MRRHFFLLERTGLDKAQMTLTEPYIAANQMYHNAIGNRVIEEQLMILFFFIHLCHAGDIGVGRGKIIKLIDFYNISR